MNIAYLIKTKHLVCFGRNDNMGKNIQLNVSHLRIVQIKACDNLRVANIKIKRNVSF